MEGSGGWGWENKVSGIVNIGRAAGPLGVNANRPGPDVAMEQ